MQWASLLSFFANIVENAVLANNPKYSQVIQVASTGINQELASIAAGNALTLHNAAPAIATVAAAAVAGGAQAVAANNPKLAPTINALAPQAESAVAQAISPTPAS